MSLTKLIIKASKLFNRQLYATVARNCSGEVLDIGGHHFFNDLTARVPGLGYKAWKTLEPDPARLPESDPARAFEAVVGDGQAMDFPDNSFDTVLCLQVLEHVPRPEQMIRELARVLRPGGRAVLLVPQTTAIHAIPSFYCNFSKYWVRFVAQEAGLRILQTRPLGGLWRTIAFRCMNMFLMLLRIEGFSSAEEWRSPLFWCLLPLSASAALAILPFALLFSLADMHEDACNHLVVLEK